jgi:hypothetical protein
MRSQSSRNELANGSYQSLYNFQRKEEEGWGTLSTTNGANNFAFLSLSLFCISLFTFWGCAHYYAIWYLVFSSSSSFFFCFARDIYNEGVQCAFYASYLTLHYFPSRSRRTLLLIFLSIFYYLMWIYIVCQSVTHHTQKKNESFFFFYDGLLLTVEKTYI